MMLMLLEPALLLDPALDAGSVDVLPTCLRVDAVALRSAMIRVPLRP